MLGWRKRRSDSAETRAGNPEAEDLRCSFCNKPQAAVQKLIAGPAVHICDECVAVCADIMADDQRFARPEQHSPPEPDRATVSCSLCGQSTALQKTLLVRDRGLLCGSCADAIEDALKEGRSR